MHPWVLVVINPHLLMTLGMTLSCELRFDMVPPTGVSATHTRVGGPPTSLATQLGLRETHGCFTNQHKPKHMVWALLFFIFSLPYANAHNGHIFLNHSFTKWLHATSGDSNSMACSQQRASLTQLHVADSHLSMKTLDDTGDFYGSFDWSYSIWAHTAHIPSFSPFKPDLDAPRQSEDFCVQQSVSHKYKDLRIANHPFKIAIVAQFLAYHLIGMQTSDVPILSAKESQDQSQLVHEPHGQTSTSTPLFHLGWFEVRHHGPGGLFNGRRVERMHLPYFCKSHDFSPLCFRRESRVSSILPRGSYHTGGGTSGKCYEDLESSASDGDMGLVHMAVENTPDSFFWSSLYFSPFVQHNMEYVHVPYGVVHVPHSGVPNDPGLYAVRHVQLTSIAADCAGCLEALDVELHLTLSDSALRGRSMRDLLVLDGGQDDWCALLGLGSAVDVCAEFAPMAPGLSHTHYDYSALYDALDAYLLSFTDSSTTVTTVTNDPINGEYGCRFALDVVCRGESKRQEFKPTSDADPNPFTYAPYCVTDGHSIAYLMIAGLIHNVYRKHRWYMKRATITYHDHRRTLSKWLPILMIMITIIPVVAPPATRGKGSGSGSTVTTRLYPGTDFIPNMGDNYNFLPGMSRWDGIPYYDFEKHWWSALLIALGAIIQSGYTLLQTALEQDGGRDAGDDAADQRDHLNRKWRLYASILNYIRPTSRVYRIATKTFANDGVNLFKWLKEYGKREYDDSTLERLRRHWEEATMSNVGISFNDKALYEWMNWIDDFGDKLGKSIAQKRTKFYAGLPEAFDHVIAQERLKPSPGSLDLVHPTNYPAGHPLAGTPNPDHGKPNLDTIVKMYSKEWSRMLGAGMIKRVPKGSVYHTEECHDIDSDQSSDAYDERDEELIMAMQRSKISDRTVCMSCGGLGHGSSVDGVQCLTTQLGTKVTRSDLLKIKYPNGITFPTFDRRSKGSKSSSAHHVTDDKPPSANRVTNDMRRKKPHKSQKSKSDVHGKRLPRKEAHQSVHESPSQSGSSDDSEVVEAQFATVYHTIDVRNHRYDSYHSSTGDEEHASDVRPTEGGPPTGSMQGRCKRCGNRLVKGCQNHTASCASLKCSRCTWRTEPCSCSPTYSPPTTDSDTGDKEIASPSRSATTKARRK